MPENNRNHVSETQGQEKQKCSVLSIGQRDNQEDAEGN